MKVRIIGIGIMALLVLVTGISVRAQSDADKTQTFVGFSIGDGNFIGGTVSYAGKQNDNKIRFKVDGSLMTSSQFDQRFTSIGGRGGVQYDFEGGNKWKPYVHAMGGYYRYVSSGKYTGFSGGSVNISLGGGADYIYGDNKRLRLQGDVGVINNVTGLNVGGFIFSIGRVF